MFNKTITLLFCLYLLSACGGGSTDTASDVANNTSDQAPLDSDNDSISDNTDNCVTVANTNQADEDSDEIGDAYDTRKLSDV